MGVRLASLLDAFLPGRVAKIFAIENYASRTGAPRCDGAISGPSNHLTDLVEVGEQALLRPVRRRFFRPLNVCDTPELDGVPVTGFRSSIDPYEPCFFRLHKFVEQNAVPVVPL